MGSDEEGPKGAELALIERAISGDPEARECLALKARPRVLRWCCSLLSDRELAEDAVQEVLLRIWRYVSDIQEPSVFWTWLYRVTVGVCVRIAERNPDINPSDNGTFDRLAPLEVSLEEVATTRAFAQELLRQIDAPDRKVLDLKFQKGLSAREMGQELGISEGAARFRLHAVIKRLRVMFASGDGPEGPSR